MTPLKLIVALSVSCAMMFCAVAAASEAEGVRFDDYQLLRIDVRTQRELRTVLGIGANPWACRVGLGRQEFAVSPPQRALIDTAGLRYEVIVDNVQRLFDEEAELIRRARERAAAAEDDPDAWFSVYRTWPEVNAYIDELVAASDALVEKFTIGASHEGREIHGMRITTPGAGPKPAVLFNGCQHAREWITVMASMFIADRLVNGYGVDERITAILDSTEIIIIPIVNPDGYEHSYAEGGNRMWRKNRRVNAGSQCLGVDLNRNWDAQWGGPHTTSSNPCSDVYFGPGPHSEPEVAALASFIESDPTIIAHVDIHSYGQLVLHPWGFTNTPHPDHTVISGIAHFMAERMIAAHGMNYQFGTPGALLYMVSGAMQDWTSLLGAFGYTYELRPVGSPGFILPPEQIIPASEECLAGALALAEWAGILRPLDICETAPTVADGITEFTTRVLTTTGPDEPAHCLSFGDSNIHFDAWLRYEAGCSGMLTVSLCQSSFLTKLAVYGESCPQGPGEPIACDHLSCPAAPRSLLTIPVQQGETIHIRAGGMHAEAYGNATLEISCAPFHFADLNTDGVVDVIDLLMLLDAWGPCPRFGDCPADLNGDGVVDEDDLLSLLDAWGM